MKCMSGKHLMDSKSVLLKSPPTITPAIHFELTMVKTDAFGTLPSNNLRTVTDIENLMRFPILFFSRRIEWYTFQVFLMYGSPTTLTWSATYRTWKKSGIKKLTGIQKRIVITSYSIHYTKLYEIRVGTQA